MVHYWIAAAAILFIFELFIGTVYLLVLSLALIGASIVAWWLGTDAAFITAALLSLIGCGWIWQYKQTQPPSISDLDDLDIGQTVILEQQLSNGDWQVHYRGTLWEARETFSGHLKQGSVAKIVGRNGNLLLIE